MNTHIDGVSCRRVTAADKDTVLSLRDDVHGGIDFLESYYDYFLSLPNVYPAAIFCAEKMAGFSLVHVVDDGQTAVTCGSRVSPNYEGQGLMRVLFDHTAKWAEKYGVESIVSVEVEYPGAHATRPERFIQSAHTLNFVELILDSQNIIVPPADVGIPTDLATVSDQNLSALFKDSRTRDYIAPKGTLLIKMVPFKPTEANISFLRGIDESTKIYSDVKPNPNGCSGLLSCCTKFAAPRGSIVPEVYFIDIFGENPSSLRKHYMRHLIDISRTSTNRFGLNITLPEDVHLHYLSQCLTDSNAIHDKSLFTKPVIIHLHKWWQRRAKL